MLRGPDHIAIRLGIRRKCLIGTIDIGEAEILLKNRDSVLFAEPDNNAPGDAVQAVIPARSPYFSFFDDKKMGRITGRNKAMRIEHEGFVGTGSGGLDACSNTV